MNNKKKIISVFLTTALIVTVFNPMVSSASHGVYKVTTSLHGPPKSVSGFRGQFIHLVCLTL